MKSKKIDNSKERNVAAAFKRMCARNNFLVIRINTTGVFTRETLASNDEGKGASDYIICHCGKFIAVEIKSCWGKQTERQKLFEKRVLNALGRYYLLSSEEHIQTLENDLKSL